MFAVSRGFCAAAICLLAIAAIRAEETKKTQSIVGMWTAVKSDELPAGAVIEFSKDNKVVVHIEMDGKKITHPVGTYKREGDKVTLMAKKNGKDDNEVNTIKELTADRMILVDPKGKETEFKKAKE